MGVQNPRGGLLARTAARLMSPAESLSYRQIRAVTEAEAAYFGGEFDNPDEYQIGLATELCDLQFFMGSHGQVFTGLWLNRNQPPKDDQEILFVSNGFVTDSSQYDAKLRAYWIAKSNPDKHVIFMDQPSHGYADDYTPAQRKDLRHGHMEALGAEMWDAFERFADVNIGEKYFVKKRGASLGFRQDLDIVEASLSSGHPILNIVGFECPGTENGRRLDIHPAFHFYEGLRTSYYKNLWEEKLLQDFTLFLHTHSLIPPAKPVKVFPFGAFKDRRMAAENLYDSVLGHGEGRQVIQRLLEKEVRLVRVVGEVSQIDRYETALEQHKTFRQMFEGKGSALWMIRGESHGMTGVLSRMRIIEMMAQYAFNNIEQAVSVDDPIEIYSSDVQEGKMPVLADRQFVPYQSAVQTFTFRQPMASPGLKTP